MRHQPRTEPELFAQLNGGRLLREDRIGPRVECEAVDVLGEDQPTRRGRRLREARTDVPRRRARTPRPAR